ncbi:peptide-methionine (R)-S-oxide reductase MsrB [Terrihabitans sp. B22-R8]|uniref:peptide-methionine (R)-S-oxide reductase MsrB n=1 Tax=Terrihabitans sp. B22-R8 TaxID=3425128 RepID=UPI00403C2612
MAVTAHTSKLGFDLSPIDSYEREELAQDLTPEERHILLEHGTERPFCGVFNGSKEDGIFTCRLCGLPLFRSGAKFDSGTGWPSFFAPVSPDHVKIVRDTSYGMVREEVRCERCDSHMGHVFPDGPRPTGLRFCMNSASMSFVPEGGELPDLLERDEPRTI